MNEREVAQANELVRVYRAAGGGFRPSTLLKYVLAVVVVVVAVCVTQLLWGVVLSRPPTTFVALIAAVAFSARFLGAGPSWLTGALAAVVLAWELPPEGSFAIDPEHRERFVGTVTAYLAILLFRPGSFGGASRFFRSFSAYRSLMIRRISSLITRRVNVSSVIGWPDASRSRSV